MQKCCSIGGIQSYSEAKLNEAMAQEGIANIIVLYHSFLPTPVCDGAMYGTLVSELPSEERPPWAP